MEEEKILDINNLNHNSMTLQEVKIAGQEDESAIIDVLKLAFAADPVSRRIWPEPHRYLSSVESFAKAYGGKAFSNKTAYFVGNYSGVALWLPPNVDPDVDTMMEILQKTGSEKAKRIGPVVFEKMGNFTLTSLIGICPFLGSTRFTMEKGLVLRLWNTLPLHLTRRIFWHILNHQMNEIFHSINDMVLNCLERSKYITFHLSNDS
jgi:hypothetical protein